jgi:hypothetical protein
MRASSIRNRTSGKRRFGVILMCGFFILGISSCEKQEGSIVDFSGAAPYVSSAVITPASALLESFPLSNGSYAVTAQVAVTVSDPQGSSDIGTVTYALYRPGSQTAFAEGVLIASQGTIDATKRAFAATLAFTATRAEAGDYRCEVRATDSRQIESNTISLRLSLLLKSTPPVLGTPGLRLLAQRGTDSLLFALTIDVSDSNGYGTIRDVTVRALATRDSSVKLMFDDGQRIHGDATVGDGTYSLQFWVSPLQQAQDIVFEFNAGDADGLKAITVRRPFANRSPKFVSLNVPSTITRPTSGTKNVTFGVAVSDPDGMADVDSVYFRNLSSSSPANFSMYDDGDVTAHGDSLAGDGTYSLIVVISSTNTTGDKQFQFSVVDKGRARADSTRIITIN